MSRTSILDGIRWLRLWWPRGGQAARPKSVRVDNFVRAR